MLPELTSHLILVPTTTSATVTTAAPTTNATETPRPTNGKQTVTQNLTFRPSQIRVFFVRDGR